MVSFVSLVGRAWLLLGTVVLLTASPDHSTWLSPQRSQEPSPNSKDEKAMKDQYEPRCEKQGSRLWLLMRVTERNVFFKPLRDLRIKMTPWKFPHR